MGVVNRIPAGSQPDAARIKRLGEVGKDEKLPHGLGFIGRGQLLPRPLSHALEAVETGEGAEGHSYSLCFKPLPIPLRPQHHNVRSDAAAELALLFGATVMLQEYGPAQLRATEQGDPKVEK